MTAFLLSVCLGGKHSLMIYVDVFVCITAAQSRKPTARDRAAHQDEAIGSITQTQMPWTDVYDDEDDANDDDHSSMDLRLTFLRVSHLSCVQRKRKRAISGIISLIHSER